MRRQKMYHVINSLTLFHIYCQMLLNGMTLLNNVINWGNSCNPEQKIYSLYPQHYSTSKYFGLSFSLLMPRSILVLSISESHIPSYQKTDRAKKHKPVANAERWPNVKTAMLHCNVGNPGPNSMVWLIWILYIFAIIRGYISISIMLAMGDFEKRLLFMATKKSAKQRNRPVSQIPQCIKCTNIPKCIELEYCGFFSWKSSPGMFTLVPNWMLCSQQYKVVFCYFYHI